MSNWVVAIAKVLAAAAFMVMPTKRVYKVTSPLVEDITMNQPIRMQIVNLKKNLCMFALTKNFKLMLRFRRITQGIFKNFLYFSIHYGLILTQSLESCVVADFNARKFLMKVYLYKD